MPGSIVKSNLTPTFGYNVRAGRYVGPTGRFVARTQVRAALDTTLQRSQAEMLRVSRELVNGNMNVAEWQVAMAREMRDAHTASATLAKGGWAQMTPKDYGALGPKMKDQYGYLANFGQQIADGEQAIDGRGFMARVEMYAQAPRGTYHEVYRGVMQDAGMDECRSVLGVAEHCDECVEEADRGRIPIEDAVEIGDRQCLSRCKCQMEYRSSADAGGDEEGN